MKSNLRALLCISGLTLWSLSVIATADESVTQVAKSQTSSLGHRASQKEPIITNEAEYAEFVRKREKAYSAKSVSSATAKSVSSRYATNKK